MKACLIQPHYSTNYADSQSCFDAQIKLLEECDESMDIIVLPESADIPALAKGREDQIKSHERYTDLLIEKAKQTAVRCSSIVFVNARYPYEGDEARLRNTTYAIDRQGNVVGHYHKQHLTPGEVTKSRLDNDYTYEFEAPTIIEIEGIRFAFLTCYDFYFYESFAAMARLYPDVIIGCSHQRSDTHEALEMMSRFAAYNCNAYMLRCSISMDENSNICGATMGVAPDGAVLANMRSRVGHCVFEFDPHKKYYKPGGFGNPDCAHHEYVEKGRRPWKYRPAGSAITLPDSVMSYPRVCAHRGFNTIAPENSMPAFGAAVALGADEIEFDLWQTKDGVVVSTHDSKLDRTSNGTGRVTDHTYSELMELDFGVKYGEKFKGLRIITLEEILKKFSCHVIMNIHIKTYGNQEPADPKFLENIIALIRKYDCEKYIYFMSGNDHVLRQLGEMAPDLCRCVGGGDAPYEMVERAIEMGCRKVQLMSNRFTQEMIDKAHAHGIICNVFQSDDADLTREYLDMGIDTILTNDYQLISTVVKEYKERKLTQYSL